MDNELNTGTQNRGEGSYIYACFDTADSERVYPIIKRLYYNGWRVSYNDKSGSFIRRIRNCTVFILFLSERSARDSTLQRQLRFAADSGAKVMVYRLDGGSVSDDLLSSFLGSDNGFIDDEDALEDALFGVEELSRVQYMISDDDADDDSREESVPMSDASPYSHSDCAADFGESSASYYGHSDCAADFGESSDSFFGSAESAAACAESSDSIFDGPLPDPYDPPAPSKPSAQHSAPAVPMPMPAAPSVPDAKAKQAAPVKVKVSRINKVDFSIVTDDAVKAGKSSIVDVFMYTKGQRRIVDKMIRAAEGKKTEAARSGSRVSVRQGSMVTVLLTSDDAEVDCCSESLVWSGDALDFKFRFSLPEDYKKKQAEFACEILFDGIHISRLYFSVKLSNAKLVPVRFVRKDSRRAFVSYSHEDKQQVVNKLVSIQAVAPKIRFWMDNQSMNSGELWRNAIASAIKKSDVFLLFWSKNSRASAEVEKEWRYALQLEQGKSRRRNGANFITPVPLERPSECPPPKELEDRHFGDPSFDSNIENISDVRFIADGEKPGNIRFF